MEPIDWNGIKKRLIAIFQLIYGLVCKKINISKLKKTWLIYKCVHFVWQSESVMLLTRLACLAEVHAPYNMSQPFSVGHWQRASQHGHALRSSDSKQKSTSVV